jgi:outer membrane protein OmpA-like peptidoglycan-associated protein
MTINLIDRVKDQLTPEVLAGIADGAAESVETTRIAMNAITPALLGAIVRFAKAPSGGTRLLGLIREGGFDGFNHRELVGQISSPHARTQIKLEGSRLLDRVLGEKRLEITEELGRVTGLSAPTTGRLMSPAMPVVMSGLGEVVAEQGLGAPGLLNLLVAQEPGLARAMPEGVSPALVGLGPSRATPEAVGPEVGRDQPPPEPEAPRRSRVPSWLFAVAMVLFAILVIPRMFPGADDPFREDMGVEPDGVVRYGDEQREREAEDRAEEQAAQQHGEEQAKGKPEHGEPGKAKPGPLGHADDPAATATEASIEDVERYLEREDDEAQSFMLRSLRFDSGESSLSREAEAELDRLAELVSAHPKVVVMVTGRTDAEGEAAENRDLATERARAVSEHLVRAGVESRSVRVLSAGETEAEEEGAEADERVVEITLVKGDQPSSEPAPRY